MTIGRPLDFPHRREQPRRAGADRGRGGGGVRGDLGRVRPFPQEAGGGARADREGRPRRRSGWSRYAGRDDKRTPRRCETMCSGLFASRDVTAHDGAVAAGRDIINSTIITGLSPDELERWMQASQAERDSLVRAAEAARRDLGTTVTLVQAFLHTILARDVPPDQFAATLMQLAANWKAAGDTIEAKRGAANLFPEVEALRQQAQAAHRAERLDEVDALLAEIDRRETEAMATVKDLLAAQQASNVATKQGRIDVALSRGEAEEAARLIAEVVALTVPEANRFETLRERQDEWYVRGDTSGLATALSVAIALSRAMIHAAVNAKQRGIAYNALGNALSKLGSYETSGETLQKAVTAYQAALVERSRHRAPQEWAKTQTNLGNVLETIGDRSSNSKLIIAAINAHRLALEEITRNHAPLEWATIQSNLGNALSAIGDLRGETKNFIEAAECYKLALTEFTSESTYGDWLMTQNNLCIALWSIGQRENGTLKLEEAAIVCRVALTDRARKQDPVLWAKMQTNLGNILQTLGQREKCTQTLADAVRAYNAALEEFSQARVPHHWAATQNNLGAVFCALGELENSTQPFRDAIDAYTLALKERVRERVPIEWAATIGNLGWAIASLADRVGDLPMVEAAIAQITEAQDVMLVAANVPNAAIFHVRLSEAKAIRDRLSRP